MPDQTQTYRLHFDEAYDVEFALWRDANPDAEYTEMVDSELMNRADARIRRDNDTPTTTA